MGGDGNDDLAWKADEKEDVVVMHITHTHTLLLVIQITMMPFME